MKETARGPVGPRAAALSWTIMRYVLPEHISFCMPGDRPVFLDLTNDRYLCLATEAEQTFCRLVAGESLCTDDRCTLDELVSVGLLECSDDGSRPSACRTTPPQRSALDDNPGFDAASVLHATWRIAVAHVEMRLRSLRSSIGHLRDRKTASDFARNGEDEGLRQIAAALRHCSLIASPLDRCLPRSIAAAHMLIDRSLCPELIIGVRLQPFSAHCWVQHGPMLINETLDRVRNYTPILVV